MLKWCVCHRKIGTLVSLPISRSLLLLIHAYMTSAEHEDVRQLVDSDPIRCMPLQYSNESNQKQRLISPCRFDFYKNAHPLVATMAVVSLCKEKEASASRRISST